MAKQGEGLICLMPSGRWILWQNREKHLLPQETQKDVVEVLVRKFGKTTASLAKKAGLSRKRIEAWLAGKAKMNPTEAEEIVRILADR